MKCCPSFEQLSRAATEGISARLHAHLRRCDSCREILRRLDLLGKAARGLPTVAPDAADTRRLEQQIVGRALQARRQPVRRRAFAGVIAVAAALVLLAAIRLATPDVLESRGIVSATPGARFQHLVSHPTSPGDEAEVVRLEDGTVGVEVERLQPGERFVVATSDAEVEVRGTSFTVAAAGGLLQEVAVRSGQVEVRFAGEAPVLLRPGQRWSRPVPAVAPPSVAAAPRTVAAALLLPVAEAAPTRQPRRPRATLPTAHAAEEATSLPPAPSPSEPPLLLPEPEPPIAERAFAAAWDLLRAGDAAGAAAAFAAIPALGAAPSLEEDAAYWQIVALGRGGDAAGAVPAMENFLRLHANSPRAGEVHLMLGLQRLAAGAREEALRHLHAASADSLPAVRLRAAEVLEQMGGR